MHWERTRKCFSHRGGSQSALRTSRTRPGRRFSIGLAGAAGGSGTQPAPARPGDSLLLPSAPQHDSGSLMLPSEMLGERARTRPRARDARPHSLREAKVHLLYSVAGRGRAGVPRRLLPSRSRKVARRVCASPARCLHRAEPGCALPPGAELPRAAELLVGQP